MTRTPRTIEQRRATRSAARLRNISRQEKSNNIDESYLIIMYFKTMSGSGRMRGIQLFNELKQKYKFIYINPNIRELHNNNPSLLSKKTVVFLLKYGDITKEELDLLNNPFIIWDMIDTYIKGYADNKHYKSKLEICHLINCANSHEMKLLQQKNNKSYKIFDCIPHNWDNRVRKYQDKAKENEQLKEPKIVFLGTPHRGSFDTTFKNYKDICHIGQYVINDKNNIIGSFNVCSSFRQSNISIMKPGTKCAVASSLNCVFMANKNEYGVYDLLGDEYPYYFEEPITKQCIDETIDYIKKTYNTPVWDKAKECMERAKEKSDIINVTKEFIKHFENYFK